MGVTQEKDCEKCQTQPLAKGSKISPAESKRASEASLGSGFQPANFFSHDGGASDTCCRKTKMAGVASDNTPGNHPVLIFQSLLITHVTKKESAMAVCFIERKPQRTLLELKLST